MMRRQVCAYNSKRVRTTGPTTSSTGAYIVTGQQVGQRGRNAVGAIVSQAKTTTGEWQRSRER